MKKVDAFSLTVSVILNLMILLITAFTFKEDEKKVTGKIKIGLVALEGTNKVNYEGKKDKEGVAPTTPPAPVVEEKKPTPAPPKPATPVATQTPVAAGKKPVPKAVPEPKPAPVKKPSLDDLSKKINAPKIDAPDLKSVSAPSAPSSSSSDVAEAAIKTIGNVAGIPSGYKLGAVDGDISASWSPGNRNPEYPESAQLRGLHGVVTLRLNIDSSGNVIGVKIEKSSGVPEINLAIEKIARTWKINLSKDGKVAKGEVLLEYRFKLEGSK